MTEKAAEIFERGRRSESSSEEAWEQLDRLSDEVEWTTEWLRSNVESEGEWRYEYE